ncbi:MAG: ribonuclease R [Mariprofundaceae bacterium]|nr:ribonuclease R [Mariprofundaceae bacterium]
MSRKKTRPDSNRSEQHKKKENQSSEASPWARADKNRAAGSGSKARGKPRPERDAGQNSRHERKGKRQSTAELFTGIVSAHPDGFGFVDVPGRDKGLFLPREEMRDLMHGDEVEVRNSFQRGRESAELVRIIRQAPAIIVGQFVLQGGVGMVQPRSRRMPQSVLIKGRDSAGASDGDWVRIEIERGQRPLHGRVLDVLGNNLDPEGLIDLVVAELQLPDAFPPAVNKESESLPDAVHAADIEGRLDLRHLPFVTIDGETARDFDDAICVQARGDGFEAWVAIADVSHYVQPHSAMDAEALERSNSFYFPDRVIPMLPEKLSNGLCSLNPEVDRLAMVARMRFDVGGRRRTARMYKAVIHSHARLTYTQASAWLEERDELAVRDEKIRAMLDSAKELYLMLAEKRERRGALDLDMPEVRAVLHEGSVARMDSDERNIAHHLIEEMMLAANTAVAEYLDTHHCPLLYRVHAPPKRQSIEKLNEFLAPFDLFVRLPKMNNKDESVSPGDVQFVLQQSAGKSFAHPLQRMVLRSMQRAVYTTENEGHFGLAYQSYCHFTSPIRRYADLTVHRRLKALIEKKNPDKVQPASKLPAIGEQTSTQERKQQRGEWDVQAMLAALYHQKDVGQTMPARISGLTQRRIFFELQPTLAEAGMASDQLEGPFDLDEVSQRLVSRRNQMAYQLGDQVMVFIDSTDPVRGLINVHLCPDAVQDEQADSQA